MDLPHAGSNICCFSETQEGVTSWRGFVAYVLVSMVLSLDTKVTEESPLLVYWVEMRLSAEGLSQNVASLSRNFPPTFDSKEGQEECYLLMDGIRT